MDFSFEDRDQIGLYLNDETVTDVIDNGSYTMLTISDGETLKIIGLTGNDFDPNLRFDSVDDINAVSMQYYFYDAIL